MFITAAVFTAALSVCGYAICGVPAAVLILILGIGITTGFVMITRRRYADIDALNSYLVRVLAGDEAPGILDQEEGELSLLKTNIYKATSTLNYQKDLLSKDKLALSNAIADISHQLKTPLTSMIVMNDLLKTEDDEGKRKEFLTTQSNQLDRMSWLIQTLLKLSKIDAGTITMKPEQVQAGLLVQEVIKAFEIQMELKNISCKKQISDILTKDINTNVEKNAISVSTVFKSEISNIEEDKIKKVIEDEKDSFKNLAAICISHEDYNKVIRVLKELENGT